MRLVGLVVGEVSLVALVRLVIGEVEIGEAGEFVRL